MRRGPAVPIPDGKTRITIRLDEDIVDWLRDQVTKAGPAEVCFGVVSGRSAERLLSARSRIQTFFNLTQRSIIEPQKKRELL